MDFMVVATVIKKKHSQTDLHALKERTPTQILIQNVV